jgi:hypothetical protein
MRRLSLCTLALLFGSAVFVSTAMAARLPTSKLLVQVLSVDQESSTIDPPLMIQGRAVGEQVIETTGFVAKVLIQNVVRTDHGLASGDTIRVHYRILTGRPLPIPQTAVPLQPGESVTLEVFARDGEYERH